jgi:outer membrane lipase/esterase
MSRRLWRRSAALLSFLVLMLLGALLVPAATEAQSPFDYTLTNSAVDSGLGLTQGTAGSVTVTATRQSGFSGTVSFGTATSGSPSVSGLPAGATASFSPTSCSVGANNSTCGVTLTINVAATTPTGSFLITVTSSPLARTTLFLLRVFPRFTYSLSANPRIVTLNAGAAGSTTITAAFQGSGSVFLNSTAVVSGLPVGAGASFRGSVDCGGEVGGSCLNVLDITTSPTTPVGTYPITVSISSNPTVSPAPLASFTLAINPTPFDYSLAPNPLNVTVTAGGAGVPSTITATLTAGTPTSVNFTVAGSLPGVTATLSQPPSCTPNATCTVTLTLAATTAATPGTFAGAFTVTGSPLNKTVAVNVTVNPQPFDYSLTPNPLNVSVTAGGASVPSTITVTLLAGATQAVTLAVAGTVPAGVTAVLSQPPSCTPNPTCAVTLTITAGAAVAPGTSTFTITGSPLNKSVTVNLTVGTQPFNYSLSNSGGITVNAGASGTTTITATLLAGTTQPVSFAVSGLPSGTTATFSASSCSPTCTTTLTIAATSAAAAGSSTITVTGTPLARTTSFTLTVNLQRTLSIVSGNNQTGVINSTLPKPLVVAVTPPNPSVTVVWEVTGGAIPSATSTPTTNGLAQITLTLGPTPGNVTVRASITGGGVVAGSSVTFVINDATSTAVSGLKTYTVLGNLAITTTTVQNTNIGLRLAALRRGTTGGVSVSGLSLNVAGQPMPLGAVTTFMPSGGGGASGDGSNPLGGLGIFLNGQGSFGDQDPTNREPGFKFNTQGMTLGGDYRVTDNIVLGAAFGYLHTAADLDQSGGRVKMNGYSGSLFGSYYVGDKFYVDAIATYGRNDYGVTRNVTFGDSSVTARSDPDGRQLSVSSSAGYNFNFGSWTVGPLAKVTYINVHIDGFQERGADIFNLAVRRQTIESLATDLGGQVSYAISTPWGVLTPLARAEWEHEFKGGARFINGSLVADPLRTTFGAQANNPDRNYVNLATGITGTFQRGVSAFAHYETVLGRTNVTNHSFTAGIRFQFE